MSFFSDYLIVFFNLRKTPRLQLYLFVLYLLIVLHYENFF